MSDTYDLDIIKPQWEEYIEKRKQIEQLKNWCQDFEKSVKVLTAGATRWQMDGKVVATHAPINKFSAKKFSEENPALVEEFTEIVAERRFNEERFRAAYPELWNRYRVEQLKLNRSGVTKEIAS